MKKLLLINLPKYELLAPPSSIAALNGVAKSCGYATDIVDFNLILNSELSNDENDILDNWFMNIDNSPDEELIKKIYQLWSEHVEDKLTEHYDYVCISVFTFWSLNIARLLLTYHNRNSRTVPIVIGGNGCNSCFEDTKIPFHDWVKDFADHICLTDGEQFLANLLTNDIVYETLDNIPFPDYHNFNFNLYEESKLYITGSKGCVRRCTFCDIHNSWPTFRYRTAKNILDEILYHYNEHGITKFDFTDSLINGSVSNFYKFNCLLAEEKQKHSHLKDIQYIGQAICRSKKQMPTTNYEAMYYAGCVQLTIGIESFSGTVRNHMGKKFNNTDIDYHIQQCAYYGIPNVWLMLTGYPTETIDNHYENIKGLERYQKYIKSGTIELIRWGTTMHLMNDIPITKLVVAMSDLTDHNMYNWVYKGNPGLTLSERIRRRMELHFKSVDLGYPQPRLYKELLQLNNLAKKYCNK